jgi:hypothetical protein
MARSYTSVVLDHSADEVWAVIRPFDHYAWAGVEAQTTIEEGKAGDQVGAVRRVVMPGRVIRQKMLAHSDARRSYTYGFPDADALPVRNYVATLRVTPVTESGQAFVEWWATFDCAESEIGKWTRFYEKDGFAAWLAGLKRHMARS